MSHPVRERKAFVDGIPVAWIEPTNRRCGNPLAIWLHALSRSKDDALPVLEELANAGFLAVSFDAWQHGERGTESGDEILGRVFGNFRRYMWPILGQTTLDALRVIDWAVDEFRVGPEVVAGGVSMGGDVAVALARIEERVTRVATIVSTPDWARPGMRDLDDDSRILDQGQADAYSWWFYDRLNPLTHLEAYSRCPAITFECGGDDSHVPSDGAQRFRTAMTGRYLQAANSIYVNVHPGVGHLEAGRGRAIAMKQNCLDWLLA